jgi:nucleotide-binding universal stress UspA family protein
VRLRELTPPDKESEGAVVIDLKDALPASGNASDNARHEQWREADWTNYETNRELGSGGRFVKVLYATDGGSPAAQALALFKRVADLNRTHITVVTVVERGADAERGPTSGGEILETAATQFYEAGFVADKRLLQGQPGPAILEEIENGGFELAVLGAGNRNWLGRLLLGSVSTKVFHASPASTMIVHRFSGAASLVRVVFGTDGSEYADLALEQLIAFLDASSCRIDVLSVAEHLMPELAFPIPRMGYAASAPTPEVESEWIAAAQKIAADAARKLESAGFRTQAQAVLGAPATRLLAEGQRVEADLVAVGSRGLAAVDRAAVGSVSDQIVREAAATFVGRG